MKANLLEGRRIIGVFLRPLSAAETEYITKSSHLLGHSSGGWEVQGHRPVSGEGLLATHCEKCRGEGPIPLYLTNFQLSNDALNPFE